MARAAVGLSVTSTVIGGEGFRSNGHVADPVNAAGTAQDAADIATSSSAITATAALIATDNTNLGTSSSAVTATAALLATDTTNINSDYTALGTTDKTAVEAAVALLEADGIAPTQGHVNALRTVWDTMVTNLTTFGTHNTSLGTHSGTATSDASTLATRRTSLNTHSGTATSDASTLATRSASLTADVAPTPAATGVVLSYDRTAVGSLSVLKRAVAVLLKQVEATNDLTA